MATDPFIAVRRGDEPRRSVPLPPAQPWWATRPGDLDVHQPHQPQGGPYGYQGPDQGYALKLAHLFKGKVVLAPGERWEDASYGVLAVASRRASLSGRAPVKDDLEIAFLVWGLLPSRIPVPSRDKLAAMRRRTFADIIGDPLLLRQIADAVSEEVLYLSPREVEERMAGGAILVTIKGFDPGAER
jgi:hypothetical protein